MRSKEPTAYRVRCTARFSHSLSGESLRLIPAYAGAVIAITVPGWAPRPDRRRACRLHRPQADDSGLAMFIAAPPSFSVFSADHQSSDTQQQLLHPAFH
jgi:hypothetical protein